MHSVWQILKGTPWWVYILFFYLLSIGIKSLRPRTLSFRRVILLPLIFVSWSAYDLYIKVKFEHFSLIPCWLICLSIGAVLGYREVRKWRYEVNKRQKTLTLPGNYSTIVLILLIFSINFFFGYYYDTHAPISHGIYLLNTILGALVTGFFLGRGIVFFLRYKQA